jgi:hypothetical protein
MMPNGDGPRNHPLLAPLKLPPLGQAVMAAPLVTKTLLFLAVVGYCRSAAAKSEMSVHIPKDKPRCSTASATGTILSPAFDSSSCEWSKDTLIYILAHQSHSAADKNRASFRNDSDGLKNFREEYARAGVKVMKIESVYMDATQYSAVK